MVKEHFIMKIAYSKELMLTIKSMAKVSAFLKTVRKLKDNGSMENKKGLENSRMLTVRSNLDFGKMVNELNGYIKYKKTNQQNKHLIVVVRMANGQIPRRKIDC